ncbi:hypothetical protein FA13DRAFT_1709785 [Coprinellus micaceus]|uniref:Uncharacterized protein n=1 Tax=Coprinellus micaceus TaxID=71717 RepID=A0A4Y7TB40_COPMI|nr:hypothetical protein FA13DRAFT_1709785 [Coprinellus micaceus]
MTGREMVIAIERRIGYISIEKGNAEISSHGAYLFHPYPFTILSLVPETGKSPFYISNSKGAAQNVSEIRSGWVWGRDLRDEFIDKGNVVGMGWEWRSCRRIFCAYLLSTKRRQFIRQLAPLTCEKRRHIRAWASHLAPLGTPRIPK